MPKAWQLNLVEHECPTPSNSKLLEMSNDKDRESSLFQ